MICNNFCLYIYSTVKESQKEIISNGSDLENDTEDVNFEKSDRSQPEMNK